MRLFHFNGSQDRAVWDVSSSRQDNLTDVLENVFFKNYHNLNFKSKDYLIFSILVRLFELHHRYNERMRWQGAEIHLRIHQI